MGVRIHCLGMNYQTAQLELREKFALSPEEISAVLAQFSCRDGGQYQSIQEMVILSTCNRVEVYVVSDDSCFQVLEDFLREITGTPTENLESGLYRLSAEKATRHLLQVACGLDSMVLGEPQILGQVTDAFLRAQEQGAVGKILEKLFHAAIHSGKRARNETRIGQNPASISSQAVLLAAQIVSDLKQATVVVLGAGEMAELAVRSLVKRGVQRIMVVNRTLERARELADSWKGEALTYEQLPRAMAQADILISSTGAPHTLIHKLAVEEIFQERPERPLVILDIAVPRDVEAEVDDILGVRVFDIDTINTYLENSLSEREAEIPDVQEIIREELVLFQDYLRTLEIVPLIKELHQYIEEIRQEELERTLDRCGTLREEDLARINAMTETMVKKFLHHPILRLKRAAGSREVSEYAAICRNLFGLSGENGPVIKEEG